MGKIIKEYKLKDSIYILLSLSKSFNAFYVALPFSKIICVTSSYKNIPKSDFCAILCHEIGHYVDVWNRFLVLGDSLVSMVLSFILFQ